MTEQDFLKRYTYNPTTDSLGHGGFGDVYRAYDNYLDRYVAIKVSQVRGDIEMLRLRNEVEKASKLLHPNVAHYEECHTMLYPTGEFDFAIMQYYEDGSLDKLFGSDSLTTDARYDLLTQILEGIAYLHSEGIIHRDLKPQNVLIARRGDRYIPKITDFGISKQLDDGQSSAVSNSVLGGTRSYASPEQLKDSRIRKNTDLWSFGVIAFQMLVGKLPFDCGKYSATSEEGRLELFRQMTSGVLPEALNNVPEPWQRLIRECLTVDNEKRIAHAEDCLAILDTFKEVVPEPPVSPEPPEPEEEIYVAEVIETTPEDLATEPESKPATEPEVKPNPEPKVESNPKSTKPKIKKRSKWWLWLLLLAIVGGGVFAYLSSQPKDDPAPTPEQPSQPTAPARLISATRGTINGHEWVDLGLPSGLKWATCNVGASNPGDYGNYYAWGEITPALHNDYSDANCSTWGQNIGDIAGTSRDAARKNWGGSWRMPRKAEIEELLSQCTWTWSTQDGNDGYKVTGPNGNSIFFPAAGYRTGTSSYDVGSGGLYWSSTPYESYALLAYSLRFGSGYHNWHRYNLYCGLSVRPVSE